MAGKELGNAREVDAGWHGTRSRTVAHGEALRALRIERGLRQQKELAAAINQPRTVLSNWENGIRVPSTVVRRALAAALQIHPSTLDAPEEMTREVTPDRWSVLHAQLDGLVADEDKSRVDRFMRQADVFAGLAQNELGALRWNRLYSTAHAYRTELTALTSHSGSTSTAARAIGHSSSPARYATSSAYRPPPLPTLSAVAEHSGVHVFVVYLRSGPRGRVRAIGAEHEALGVTALLNAAAMDRGIDCSLSPSYWAPAIPPTARIGDLGHAHRIRPGPAFRTTRGRECIRSRVCSAHYRCPTRGQPRRLHDRTGITTRRHERGHASTGSITCRPPTDLPSANCGRPVTARGRLARLG